MSTFELAIPVILKHEGGYVNDSHDSGGATNYGISLRFLRSLEDKDLDGFLDGDLDQDGLTNIKDVKSMTEDQAVSLYKKCFWEPNRYGLIDNQAIATKIFDMSVNMGSKQAHKLTQRALWSYYSYQCTADDGILGKISLALINKAEEALLFAIRSEQAGFYRALMASVPKYKKFENGWLKRAYS